MPTLASQSFFGPLAGQSVSQPRSFEMPSRLGPRHCGQSSARIEWVRTRNESNLSHRKHVQDVLDENFMIKSFAIVRQRGANEQLEFLDHEPKEAHDRILHRRHLSFH